ncbi:hypothetical protein BDZ45DRAFT_803274 [Acephala macrosclerotiorum]|nr:hypothetical protein BDZ45DRAFT_803274 [Acephala macrosclerotiorum]
MSSIWQALSPNAQDSRYAFCFSASFSKGDLRFKMSGASTASLALSIFSASYDAGSLLVSIAKNVTKLLQTRSPLAHRCQLLRNEAEFLAILMDERASSQGPTGRDEVSTLIRKIDDFVQRVTARSWAVMFVTGEMEYQALREQCRRFLDAFSLEMMTITYIAQQRETKALRAGRQGVQTGLELQSGMSAKFEDIRTKEREDLPAPRATMNLDLSTIHVDPADPSVRRGITAELGSIECRKVSDTTASRRALAMFQDLQYGAYVQAIHGFAKIDEDYYVVMQDCTHLLTLAEACKRGTIPGKLNQLNQVQLAFNVAQSIGWLHAGELVLKTLNDASIGLVEGKDDALWPCITELEHVRLFSEKTNSARVDVRYEAPETERMPKHTKESDVWCLGIIIWQILTGKLPYDIAEPVDVHDVSKAKEIRFHLSKYKSPATLPPSMHEDLAEIISRCWLPASLRPPSRTVADALLRVQMELSSKLTIYPTTSDQIQEIHHNASGSGADREQLKNFQNLALGLIQKARESKRSGDVPLQKLDTKHAELLMKYSDHPLYPECAFLVGAAIWWGLLDIWLVERFVLHQAKTPNGLRAENALSYLAVARGRGHTDAYYEMSKAYAALYRDFSGRIQREH